MGAGICPIAFYVWRRSSLPATATQQSGLQHLSSTDLAYIRKLCQAFLSRLADGLGNLLGTITSHKIGRDHISSLGGHRTMKQFCVHPTDRSILARGEKKEATPSILSRDSACPHSLLLFPGQQGLDKVWAFFLGITVLGACFFGGPAIGLRAGEKTAEKTYVQTTWGKIRTQL